MGYRLYVLSHPDHHNYQEYDQEDESWFCQQHPRRDVIKDQGQEDVTIAGPSWWCHVTLSRMSRGEMLRCHKTQITQTKTSHRVPEGTSLINTYTGSQERKYCRQIEAGYFSKFIFDGVSISEKTFGYMTPLSAPRVWLFLWWDVHNNFNPLSTKFDKSKNQGTISAINNILIVILCSTKEYLESPKIQRLLT